jgi:polyisoprenoid-binding protein YceI
MKAAAAALTAVFLTLPAAAQGISTDASLAPAGTYEVDKAHTRVSWQISHFGVSTYTGWFKGFDIELNFDPNAPEKSSLKTTIDPKSVFTFDPKFDEEIASAKFFDAAKYPEITFVSSGIEKTGDTTGKMTGDLTFHGVTKPVTLDVTFHGGMQSPLKNTYVLGFEAKGTIKRSEFGVTEYIDFGLGDDVTITIEGEFDHKGE